MDVIWKFALCSCTLFLTIRRKCTSVLQLAIPWCDFFLSGVENNSYYSHWYALAFSATRVTDETKVTHRHKALWGLCPPEGITIPHSPSLGEPTTSRIRPSIWCSLFLPAGAFLSYPFHSPYAYKTRGWDARRNATILLQINHARIVVIAPVVVGVIVLPRFVSLGLANCLPTTFARTRREQMR